MHLTWRLKDFYKRQFVLTTQAKPGWALQRAVAGPGAPGSTLNVVCRDKKRSHTDASEAPGRFYPLCKEKLTRQEKAKKGVTPVDRKAKSERRLEFCGVLAVQRGPGWSSRVRTRKWRRDAQPSAAICPASTPAKLRPRVTHPPLGERKSVSSSSPAPNIVLSFRPAAGRTSD